MLRFVRTTTQRGFTLIELLVVIAIIGVLIDLLIPDVSSVRGGSGKGAGQSQISQGLCPPPLCGTINANVTLQFPLIPQSVTPASLFQNGAWVSYDPAFVANGEPFVLQPPGTPDTFFVDIPPLPQLIEAQDYRIGPDARYQNGSVLLPIVRDSTGESFTLALTANGTAAVDVAEETVPEPSTAPVIAAAVLVSALARRYLR